MQPFTVRFWSKVDKRGPDECWLWTAAKDGYGYGVIGRGGKGAPMVKSHRASWEIHNGPIPQGEGYHGTCVLHICDVPACCNPRHLRLGTSADNVHDMMAKGRQVIPLGEARGNVKITAAQAREIRASTGTHREIGERFGISQSQVSNIKARKQWAAA